MSSIAAYLRPGSLAEALEILREKGSHAAIVAGGTSVTLRRPAGVDTLVDITNLGMDGIRTGDGFLEIGSCTRLSDLIGSSDVQKLHSGILAQAARNVASTPLRNLITLGGNALHVFSWSDLPGVLLACKAEFVIAGETRRIVPADELYLNHPEKLLSPGELLTAIRFPLPTGRSTGAFHKESKTQFDYAAMSIATVVWFEGSQIRDIRVVAGSLRPLPIRLRPAEEELKGKAPTHKDVVTAAARAAGSAEPAQDYRYSTEYKTTLVKVWAKRCLLKSLDME